MAVLERVLDRIRETAQALAIFDIDSTILSTQERNYRILQEFSREPGTPADLPDFVARLAPRDMGWNIMEDLRRVGFGHDATLDRLRGYWRERFFHDDYLLYDRPIPGAAEFVRDVHAAGATIVYLTGRDEPGMGRGTRASLAEHGFPLGERVVLRLKPRWEDEDLAFKRQAISELHSMGTVVAAFENEPANANLFLEAFPQANVLFLETVHSPDPPPLLHGIERLRDFVHR